MYECTNTINTLYYKRKRHNRIYIDFVNWAELPSIPDGFKKDKKDNVIRYMFVKNLTDEEFEKEKQNRLNILLEWCNELPEFEGSR